MTENCKMMMDTQSSLESFNPSAESIEDYKEWFDFYCTAHQILKARRKALFLTRIDCDAFAKLKTLVSPTLLNDVSLPGIVTTMMQHYKKDSRTIQVLQADPTGERVSCRLHSRTSEVKQNLQFWRLPGYSTLGSISMWVK